MVAAAVYVTVSLNIFERKSCHLQKRGSGSSVQERGLQGGRSKLFIFKYWARLQFANTLRSLCFSYESTSANVNLCCASATTISTFFLFFCSRNTMSHWCRLFQNIACFPSIEPSQFSAPAHFKIIDQVAQIYQISFHVSGTTVDTVDLCLVEGNLSVKYVGAGEFLGVQRVFGQTML